MDSANSCRGDGGAMAGRWGEGQNCYVQAGGLVRGRWGSSFMEGMNGEVGGRPDTERAEGFEDRVSRSDG
jgi:hypothetical protein